MTKRKAIIIGGGPAGLTAAYEFLKYTDIQPIVLEQSEYWGGISKTVNYKGNRIDIGGHRFFSKSEEIMNWWKEILPIQNENNINSDDILLIRNRKSRIYYNKNYFDYPISLSIETLKKLGIINSILIILSYLYVKIKPIKHEKNLEDFMVNRFGRKLFRTFFKDYTEKVWGVSCKDISPEWGAQRIKKLSIRKILLHYFRRKDKDISQKKSETSLIEYFLYPKFGPGQLWEKVAEIIQNKGGILIQNAKVIKLHGDENFINEVEFKNIKNDIIEKIKIDYIISTMPIKDLFNSFTFNISDELINISNGLQYRDFITIGVLIKKIKVKSLEDNWIYIQEPDLKVGRLQIFNNWSPFMVENKSNYWIGLEYFCNEKDDFWNKTDDELKKLAVIELEKIGIVDNDCVLDSVVIRERKTYPSYFGTYKEINKLVEFLKKIENLHPIGRNGMHKYNNQDHSMLTAIKTVQLIKNNSFNKDFIWSINTEQSYQEEK